MVTYSHESASEQMLQEVERLPDNVLEYNTSPIALRAVPILPLELPADGADEFEGVSAEDDDADSAEADSAEADLAEADSSSESESDEAASVSTDTEEEEDGSLLMADVSPQELCTYALTLWLCFSIAARASLWGCHAALPLC